MDDSKKFIKMCDKAGLKHKPQEGDLYYDKRYKEFYWNCKIGKLKKRWQYIQKCVEEDIWMPQQDQLQEMIECDGDIQSKFILFYQFARGGISGEKIDELVKKRKYAFQFNTFEQLWLAFVKHEKDNKMWDDEKEEWIKKN